MRGAEGVVIDRYGGGIVHWERPWLQGPPMIHGEAF